MKANMDVLTQHYLVEIVLGWGRMKSHSRIKNLYSSPELDERGMEEGPALILRANTTAMSSPTKPLFVAGHCERFAVWNAKS